MTFAKKMQQRHPKSHQHDAEFPSMHQTKEQSSEILMGHIDGDAIVIRRKIGAISQVVRACFFLPFVVAFFSSGLDFSFQQVICPVCAESVPISVCFALDAFIQLSLFRA
jgi:hypothetical protein